VEMDCLSAGPGSSSAVAFLRMNVDYK
jgi:hypothetical protein